VRTMASSAQQQLSKELGPEFENMDLRDLNPRTFVQKHLLDDVEPIIADVKAEVTDVGKTIKDSSADITEKINSADPATGPQHNGMDGGGRDTDGASKPRALTPFDLEAT
jgi:sec-independent protein translocase protein TatB